MKVCNVFRKLPYFTYNLKGHRNFKKCVHLGLRNMSEVNTDESASQTKDSNIIKEGKAEVFLPKSVFYNPVQEFNRDLTIAVISEFAKDLIKKCIEKKTGSPENDGSQQNEDGSYSTDDEILFEKGKHCSDGLKILEGLSASGLRSVRFALEIPGVKEIVANDFDEGAVKYIEKNIVHNKVQELMRSNHGDAAMVMYMNRSFSDRFDVIDIDPYGSPAPFLDGAVQSISDGGLLCITCTDTAILCGNTGETCFAKYGAMSLRTKYCHEMALRIILQAIESHANCYSRYIVPVLSLSVDFYIRVFVKVFTGQSQVKNSVCKRSMVYHCFGCGSFFLQPIARKVRTKGDNFKFVAAHGPPTGKKCPHCDCQMHIGGPIWTDPIHDVDFVNKVQESVSKSPDVFMTSDRIMGVLSVASEEIQDAPLYYVVDGLCTALHCSPPTFLDFRSAILNAGYNVSLSHAAKNSCKTDAPSELIWDIMRAWVKEHPISENRIKSGTVARNILQKEPSVDISFKLHPKANPESRQKGLLRYQVNPEKDWGPKSRAKRSADDESTKTEICKQKKNQGKKTEPKIRDPNYLKQFPCKNFKKGQCEHGDDCKYNHNDSASDSVNSELPEEMEEN